ncbi:uncharacterized protein JCM6883_007345 [Sporobolomyces salmoneus]|uniref:uncharacterized protein n=1 Tax=Sporobolomyces salmoneus TaxID=183962 RepID=UPI0031737689
MKLIITGANGSAGSEVLRQALLDSRVTAVTTLTRSPLPPYLLAPAPDTTPPKLTQIIHSDFSSYPPSLLEKLRGHDAAIWALGTSSVGVEEAEYTKITYGYAMEAAKALSTLKEGRDGEGKFVFAYLSGARTTQTPSEGSGFFSTPMWARVKGRTELELAQLPHIQAYSFRPAFIVPLTLPPPEHRSRYNTPFFQTLGKFIGSFSSSGAVGADVLAKGMLRACLEGSQAGGIPGWEGKGKEGNEGVFENEEIRRLGEGLAAK